MKSTHKRHMAIVGMAVAMVVASASVGRAEPAKPDELIIRDWPGPWGEAMAAVGKAFTDKTGIKVQIDKREDAAVEKLMQAAHAQNREPPVDIMYTMETNSYRDSAQGLSDPLTTADIPNLSNMLGSAMPDSGQWDYVTIAQDIMTLVYRASAFPDGAPDSFTSLFDPKLKGRVYSNAGAEANVAVVAKLNDWSIPQDMDKIWSFLETKFAPMNPVLGYDTELMAGFQRHEVDLALTFPSNAAALKDPDVKIAMPKEGVYGDGEAFFIPSGLSESRKYWARQFVNFFLSKEMLTQYCNELTLACNAKDLPVPPNAGNDPSFPRTPAERDKIFRIPVKTLAENMATWDAKFNALVK